MKPAPVGTILLTVMALSGAAVAEGPPAFAPQSTSILGTATSHTPTPYTQVISQLSGELAIDSTDELFINLAPNWPKLARALLTEKQPVIAYTTVAWADQALRVTCWLDRANSHLVRGQIRIVMEVTEGTFSSVPVGSIFAISDAQLIRRRGAFGLKTHIVVTPGIFPDVMPTSMSMTTQLVPDLWSTGKPGHVSAEYTFTSIPPPDGSPPIVYTIRERLPVQ